VLLPLLLLLLLLVQSAYDGYQELAAFTKFGGAGAQSVYSLAHKGSTGKSCHQEMKAAGVNNSTGLRGCWLVVETHLPFMTWRCCSPERVLPCS
jgi:hypothetical protein